MPKSNATTITAWVIVAFLAYLLSAGPMMRLADRYWIITPDTFETIYAPLGLLVNVPGFAKGMNCYLMLWEPHHYSDQSAAYPASKPAPPAKTEKSAKP